MQEDIDNRTVALTVKATKLTAQGLAKVFAAALRKIQQAHRDGQTPQGRQSVKKLMNHRAATSSIPLDGDTRLFDRVARKWNVDYSFHKTGPNKYLLLFKSGQGRRSVNAQGRRRVMNDKVKKYVLPNIPYLFIGWMCLKLGTAYRMAAGANFGMKLIGTMQTIGPAFENAAPGLNATDWLVGIAGAVVIRLVVYQKSKKAENSEGMWSTARPGGVRKKTSNRL